MYSACVTSCSTTSPGRTRSRSALHSIYDEPRVTSRRSVWNVALTLNRSLGSSSLVQTLSCALNSAVQNDDIFPRPLKLDEFYLTLNNCPVFINDLRLFKKVSYQLVVRLAVRDTTDSAKLFLLKNNCARNNLGIAARGPRVVPCCMKIKLEGTVKA